MLVFGLGTANDEPLCHVSCHHLGFRVRIVTEHNRFVLPRPAKGITLEAARRANAWTLHLHKTNWDV
jgi:hypothetical protein